VASYDRQSTLFCTILLAPITLRLCTLLQERRKWISVARARTDLCISVFLEHTNHTSHVLLQDKRCCQIGLLVALNDGMLNE